MPHEGSLLQTAVIFLLAAVLAVPLAKRLQLGAVLGYLLAGVIIGPQALGQRDGEDSGKQEDHRSLQKAAFVWHWLVLHELPGQR